MSNRVSTTEHTEYIYVIEMTRGCPRMWLFRYVWYWSRYVYRFYILTKHNIRSLTFGNFKRFLVVTANNIFKGRHYIEMEYQTYFKQDFDWYDEITKC